MFYKLILIFSCENNVLFFIRLGLFVPFRTDVGVGQRLNQVAIVFLLFVSNFFIGLEIYSIRLLVDFLVLAVWPVDQSQFGFIVGDRFFVEFRRVWWWFKCIFRKRRNTIVLFEGLLLGITDVRFVLLQLAVVLAESKILFWIFLHTIHRK